MKTTIRFTTTTTTCQFYQQQLVSVFISDIYSYNQLENWLFAAGNSQQHSQNFQESISVPSSSDWKPETGSPNLKRDEQDKMAHELKEHSKVHQQESKTREDQSLIKSAKIEKHGHTGHETMRLAVADKFKSEQDETVDGLAEAPGGAILSLTFGTYTNNFQLILVLT